MSHDHNRVIAGPLSLPAWRTHESPNDEAPQHDVLTMSSTNPVNPISAYTSWRILLSTTGRSNDECSWIPSIYSKRWTLKVPLFAGVVVSVQESLSGLYILQLMDGSGTSIGAFLSADTARCFPLVLVVGSALLMHDASLYEEPVSRSSWTEGAATDVFINVHADNIVCCFPNNDDNQQKSHEPTDKHAFSVPHVHVQSLYGKLNSVHNSQPLTVALSQSLTEQPISSPPRSRVRSID